MNNSQNEDMSYEDLVNLYRNLTPMDEEIMYNRARDYEFFLSHKFRNMRDTNKRLDEINNNLINYPGDFAYFRSARAQQEVLREITSQVEQKFAERGALMEYINAKYNARLKTTHTFEPAQYAIYSEAINNINRKYE